ncbi:PQQ-binding-like beta-propeller repeat protein [Hoyosella sp. G463]|uniref:PQQ-binding-like beta-propeller repeat protein n=1 Tax=Lolliginicoccus lacisalsi TaxID=2742202 RepID=A0A927JCE1_9ACTN|nr:PQQ-binding-like beta-propeller repeat protein [Lolliginicoccus lacisalsi]MBD8506639.1 PQQ-binding-like beta-propeller repeat protein [Lolliginicoccus lacisalsi]
MIAPERRHRADIAVAALLVAVLAVAALGVWWSSPARHASLVTAAEPIPEATSATTVPGALAEAWRARSPGTTMPLVARGAVLSVRAHEASGLDARSGEQAWSYRRAEPVCAATTTWNKVIVVFRGPRGCSEVASLDPATGDRGAQRTSEADDSVTLESDGSRFVSFGPTRLEAWRSDLVRTLEFGRVSAPIEPGSQPRQDCEIRDATITRSRIPMIVKCPDDVGERLVMLASDPETFRQPEEFGDSLLTRTDATLGEVPGVDGARIVSASPQTTVIVVPGDRPTIAMFDGRGNPRARHELPPGVAPEHVEDTSGEHAGAALPAVIDGNSGITVWDTGAGLLALSPNDQRPLWTFPGSLGQPAMMAGRLLVPVPSGIAVVDVRTGEPARVLAVDREQVPGSVNLAVSGEVVIEQRGETLVALAPGS